MNYMQIMSSSTCTMYIETTASSTYNSSVTHWVLNENVIVVCCCFILNLFSIILLYVCMEIGDTCRHKATLNKQLCASFSLNDSFWHFLAMRCVSMIDVSGITYSYRMCGQISAATLKFMTIMRRNNNRAKKN